MGKANRNNDFSNVIFTDCFFFFFFFSKTKALLQFILVMLFPKYRGLSYPGHYMQPGCQLRTTSEQCHFTTYTGYHYIKHLLPTGPMCPSSHDLPWLSKPLILLIFTPHLANTCTNSGHPSCP